jgi:hypothetical protein
MRFLLVSVLLLTACDKPPMAVVPAAPLMIAAVAGDGQVAVVHRTVPISPTVIVTRNSQPVTGVAVVFNTSPDFVEWDALGYHKFGGVGVDTVFTDSSGIAKLKWALRSLAGPDSVTAMIPGAAPIVFVATALPDSPYGYAKIAGDTQTVAAGSSLTKLPAVRVTDLDANAVPGVSVVFVVTGGGGVITGAATQTGPDGIARPASWTLGSTPGTNTVVAYIPIAGGAVLPFTFTETGAPPSVTSR